MKKRELLPPADDTASRTLVNVQTAITRVKEIVSKGVANGWDEQVLSKELNKAIATECNRVEPSFKEPFRKALVSAAKKWHYQLSQTFRILDNNLAQEAKKQPLNIDLHNLLKKTPYQKQIEFRRLLDDGTNPGIPVIKDYQKSVRLLTKALSVDSPKIVATRNGKAYVMPARLRAELAVRHAAAVENLQHLIDDGVLWCWISSHANCSPRCKDFQGKLYSLFEGSIELDGKKYGESGTVDGIPYRPIKEALAGPNGDGNGCISGYNCRHRAIEYERGSRPPADFTEAEIKREYAIDKQQRAYENRIRQLKQEERQLRACGMDKEAKALRKKWRVLTKDYQIYSLEHNRAYYPYRYVVDRDETEESFQLDDYLERAKNLGHKKQESILTNYKNQFIMEQERLREPTDFVLAKTVQEAEQYMARRVANVSYNGITNVKSLNQANRTFAYLFDKYELKSLNEVSTRMRNSSAFAESHGDILRIGKGFANNPQNNSVIDSSSGWVKDRTQKLNVAKDTLKIVTSQKTRNELEQNIQQYEESLKYSRHNVIYEDQEVESVITHEVGHIIAEQKFQQLSRSWANGGQAEIIRNTFKTARENGDIYKISMYANKNVFEFFAECFTIYEMGKEKLPTYIKEMVKEAIK